MEQRPPVVRGRTQRLHRIAAKGIDTECQQHDASHHLQEHLVLQNQFIHETHAVSRNQRITDIAQGSSQTCNKTVPASFVQCTLNAKHADRPQRSGNHHSHDDALYQ